MPVGRGRTEEIDKTNPISAPGGRFDRGSGRFRWPGRGERGPIECCAFRRLASTCLRDDMDWTESCRPWFHNSWWKGGRRGGVGCRSLRIKGNGA